MKSRPRRARPSQPPAPRGPPPPPAPRNRRPADTLSYRRMADTSAPAIEIHGVRKTFDRTVALDGLDLSVPRGVTYGLLGPNGSGKTTTVRLILGILEPDRGDIRLLGDTRSPAILDRVGYLPEERGLYRRMRVRPLLLFLAEL